MCEPKWNYGLDDALIGMIGRGISGKFVFREYARHGFSELAVVGRLHALMFDAGATSDVLFRARCLLLGRAVECNRSPSGWRLDGRVCSAALMITQANIVLETFGEPPINFPGLTAKTSKLFAKNGRGRPRKFTGKHERATAEPGPAVGQSWLDHSAPTLAEVAR